MKRVSLPAVAAIVGALTIVAAGCSTSGGPEPVTDPRATSTTTVTTQPDDAPGADDVVWQELASGGFVPQEYAAGLVPNVTIYGDGRIFTTAHGPDGQVGPPVALDEGKVAAADLARFLDDADASGLFERGVDFGSPGVTDQTSTAVTLRVGEVPRQVDVYALDFPDDTATDLTAAQVERRSQLRDLVARARSLGKDRAPYLPDRVRATLFSPQTSGGQPSSPAPWPGPPLSSFPAADEATGQSCLVIEGDAAAAAYRADQDQTDTAWDVDGEVRTIVVVPLLPGQEGCPPS